MLPARPNDKALLQAIIDSAPIAIVSLDTEFRVLTWSRSAERIFGYAHADVVGQRYPLVPEGGWEDFERLYRRVIVDGERVRDISVSRRRKDGRLLDVLFSGAPLFDDSGRIVGAVYALEDVTERKMMSERLRQVEQAHFVEERFRLMVDSVRDYAIFTLDPDGHIESWHGGAEQVTGYTAPEIIGRHFSMFYTDEDRQRDHPQHELEIAAQTGRYEEEGWRVRKGGARLWTSITITAVRGPDGKILGFTKVTRDMTEKREAEQAIQRLNDELQQRLKDLAVTNQELEAFTYSVSHDLRAPLRAIDGFSRILEEDHAEQLGENGRHVVEVVRKSAQTMGRLIDDLLAFSRLGRQSPKMEAIPLKSLVESVISDLRGEYANRKVEFSVGELGSVQADPALLKQALANLIGNAIKYSRNKDVAVIEVGRRQEPDGGTVYFVKDNGAGFDMRFANKLFSVFQRLHRAEEYEGTGVGLAIVQRVIHRHGGRVWADAKVGEGATFYFTITPSPEAAADARVA